MTSDPVRTIIVVVSLENKAGFRRYPGNIAHKGYGVCLRGQFNNGISKESKPVSISFPSIAFQFGLNGRGDILAAI